MWCSYLYKNLHVMECGMAWKVLNIFSLQWQSLKGVNYSIWIAFLTFLNKNPNVAKNRDVIEKNWVEKNWVHFSIQQPRNIPNQFTDLKQLKKTFFFVYQCYTSIWWTSAQPRSATSSSFRGGSNFHEISFDDVIVLVQPWCNFFANGHR